MALKFIDIHKEQMEIRKGLRDGTITVQEAKEMNNALGKSIAQFRAVLEQYAMREEKPEKTFSLASR